MEKKYKSTKSIRSGFFRRNAYYIAIGLALIITAVTLILVFTLKPVATIPVVEDPFEEIPVVKPVTFVLPVENGTLEKDYYGKRLAYNATLKQWEAHQGVDFTAPAGSAVFAAYDGTVQSVKNTMLDGTVITIIHDGGLKTVYKSLDKQVSVAEGDTVRAGQTIGKISNTQLTELKTGAHLHFETFLNNKAIDPNIYIDIDEK